MYCAVIDIGSNSSRLNVFSVNPDGSYTVVGGGRVPTGLIGYKTDSGELSEEGIQVEIAALERLLSEARGIANIDRWHVFATASLRSMNNGEEAAAQIEESIGFPIEIITGKEEAEFGFSSLCAKYDSKSLVMADIGGGSTEIVVADDGEVLLIESLPIGSRRLSQDFADTIWPDDTQIEFVASQVRAALQELAIKRMPNNPILFGIGGTARALEQMIEGGSVTLPEDLKKVAEITCPERMDTICAGAEIFKGLVAYFKPASFVASSANPREGYLIQRVIPNLSLAE